MGNKLRRYFFSGAIIFLPLSLTVYLFVITINFADGLLGKFIEPYVMDKFGFYYRGMSIIVLMSLIVAIGFFVANFLGKRIYAVFEGLMLKLPFFKQVYPAIKEIALFIFSREKLKFKQVVLVEYPRKGIYSFGFLTNDSAEKICEKTRQELCNIFIPSAPGPLTGFVVFVPKKDLIFADISVEEVVKCIVSGGVVNPI